MGKLLLPIAPPIYNVQGSRKLRQIKDTRKTCLIGRLAAQAKEKTPLEFNPAGFLASGLAPPAMAIAEAVEVTDAVMM
jgi:hypothetical protein